MNFEPHICVIFVKSTKIGTHKNKAIQSTNEKYTKVMKDGPKLQF